MKNESLKIMLSVLAVGILLTGCRSKNEGNGTDNSSDRTTETDQNKEKKRNINLRKYKRRNNVTGRNECFNRRANY